MFSHICRHLVRRGLVGGILRGIGAAMLAGIGWKLGTDAYEAIKKRPQAPEPEPDEY